MESGMRGKFGRKLNGSHCRVGNSTTVFPEPRSHIPSLETKTCHRHPLSLPGLDLGGLRKTSIERAFLKRPSVMAAEICVATTGLCSRREERVKELHLFGRRCNGENTYVCRRAGKSDS
ncbi:hypothetical protein CIHG_07210 [Coccidioides immitis H538.4]|uniref:Uncharacterized protein n=2 Tax=Coccidioides immitis TaxID=5501 RepID=A0A0J8UPF8_COCIT|nr:hypothetical protein CIRG_09117 [Coccidioides immitis RMSCC 2394]KMU89403.1 hypothetical protein CIHG_07210 [Coccidioides immitis H538.4]